MVRASIRLRDVDGRSLVRTEIEWTFPLLHRNLKEGNGKLMKNPTATPKVDRRSHSCPEC